MKQLPKALDRNGDLWVPCVTKQLVFRALQDAKTALEATQGIEVKRGHAVAQVDHSEQLRALALVETLLGVHALDQPLRPVHEQLGELGPAQARMLRNLARVHPI
jgi:hypothetical protein